MEQKEHFFGGSVPPRVDRLEIILERGFALSDSFGGSYSDDLGDDYEGEFN